MSRCKHINIDCNCEPPEPDYGDIDEKAELDRADQDAHQDWKRYGW